MLEIRVSINLLICFGGLDTRPDRVREPVNLIVIAHQPLWICYLELYRSVFAFEKIRLHCTTFASDLSSAVVFSVGAPRRASSDRFVAAASSFRGRPRRLRFFSFFTAPLCRFVVLVCVRFAFFAKLKNFG